MPIINIWRVLGQPQPIKFQSSLGSHGSGQVLRWIANNTSIRLSFVYRIAYVSKCLTSYFAATFSAAVFLIYLCSAWVFTADMYVI